MKDAVTIVVFHISRQHGQSLLNVGQDLRLKAGADFLQGVRPGSGPSGGQASAAKLLPQTGPPPACLPRRVARRSRYLSIGMTLAERNQR